MIEVKGLEKRYKNKVAVKNVSFELRRNRCTALLGPNGAGKTTTLNMLAGLVTPTGGRVTTEATISDIREIIGYLPQYPTFYDWMTGMEYLIFSGEIAGMTKSEVRNRAEGLIRDVGLEEGRNRRIGQYSGGMKQRLGIAQALIHRPQLLILDEPLSALDPFGRREVLELLEKLKQETTILFSTHILNDAEQTCDDVLFLHEGSLIEQGPINEVKRRHQAPKLNLYFPEGAQSVEHFFVNQEWIRSVKSNGNQLTIEVSDPARDRLNVFSMITKHQWNVTKVESCEGSLEELFMEVIKK
ncbi:ABC transporter ATP-binding protein [Bacillus sp. KH172YL63]|uniref:ABC transporter ATP-binding protein n=1 Tax=Bacillus sp. KH172YL63 TaxID=2709784 RepID=UPI0013E47B99|nr:ABC transporter ATP-binding protein [Bacillus sp. KH172YL63]BCB04373.1 putative ABC transporter ATP-binding protein YxlF [Bacillus sp. KH172YL63]